MNPIPLSTKHHWQILVPMRTFLTSTMVSGMGHRTEDIGLEEFCRLLAVINEREGFSKSEYDRAGPAEGYGD